jgi:hypothetical protein
MQQVPPLNMQPFSPKMSALEASIGAQMMKTAEGNLFRLSNAAGLMLGMVVMWATSLLVSA